MQVEMQSAVAQRNVARAAVKKVSNAMSDDFSYAAQVFIMAVKKVIRLAVCGSCTDCLLFT